jgi:glycerophosphoryl diester phosphodiesterase
MPGLDWLTARPIAHRGLHDAAIVENSLDAADAAIAGNYSIEADLQLTRDEEVVVFHDAELDRLTRASGLLKARTLAELRKIPFRDGPGHIPNLREFLTRVAGRVPLFLELKSEWNEDTRLAARSAAILESYAGPVAALSFDPDLLVALNNVAPGLPRGIVAERRYDKPGFSAWRKFALGNLLHIPRTKPHFVAYGVRDLPAFAPLLARWLLGMPLLTWTVREAERERALRWADQMIFEGFQP